MKGYYEGHHKSSENGLISPKRSIKSKLFDKAMYVAYMCVKYDAFITIRADTVTICM